MNTKLFTVVWFYVANHGSVEVEADSAEEAISKALFLFLANENFVRKAEVRVFEGVPTLHYKSGGLEGYGEF